MSQLKKRTRSRAENRPRKLLTRPSFTCDIVESETHFHLAETGLEAPDYPIPPQSHLSRRISNERYTRTLNDAFNQCHCPLRNDFLKPIGQALKFTTGLTDSGQATAQSDCRTQYIPTQLMDATQRTDYSSLTTGMVCWWCSYEILGPVVGCPTGFRRFVDPHTQKKRDGYRFLGYFCSWPCARAYGNTHLSPNLRDNLGMWMTSVLLCIITKLREIGKIEVGFHPPHVRPAPHFSLLRKFGGSLNIEEFRKVTELDNGKELTVVPDWVTIVPSGMRITETPLSPRSFSEEFNVRAVIANCKPELRQRFTRKDIPMVTTLQSRRILQKTAVTARSEIDQSANVGSSVSITGNPKPLPNPIQMCLGKHHRSSLA